MVVHDQRLNMWTEFNYSWLALLQRQKEVTEQMKRHNQDPALSDSLLDARSLEHIGKEMIRLCDEVERYGLVDYEMGVAEEEILDSKTSIPWTNTITAKTH